MEQQAQKIVFEKEQSCDFFTVLKERVHSLVQTKNLGPKAKLRGHLKTTFFISLCIMFYIFILKAHLSPLAFILCFALYGVVAALSVMNISHDALHNAYGSNAKFNRALGFFGDFFGPSSFFWRKEHTIDHHIFTNIHEHDADLGTTSLLRLCPNQPLRKIHRFQLFYAPILYCFNLIHWIFKSDFKRLYKLYILHNKKLPKPTPFELFMFFFFKSLHVVAFLLIPYHLHQFSFLFVLGSYLTFLGMIGLSLTTIFQLAHIVENVTFPLPNQDGKIMNTFARHQLATTSNFGISSRITRFLFGGLNFQVEHHLFPHLYHGYLHLIAPIVQKTAAEFNVPYHVQSSLASAIGSHFKTLYRLGNPSKEPSTLNPVNSL